MLVVDCCIRGADSATRRYYQAYLRRERVRDAQVLELAKLGLAPLDAAALAERDALCRQGKWDHEMFRLARQFRDAEEILIAAPFWDLSFPALLKVYLEWVSVSGVTFGYDREGRCHGYCQAKRLWYFSTCGGYVGKCHLGYEYVKALAHMLGIPACVPYIVEGLDIDPAQREALLEQAIARLPEGRMEEGTR